MVKNSTWFQNIPNKKLQILEIRHYSILPFNNRKTIPQLN